MTVQELIDRLRTYHPELLVGINCEKAEGLDPHPVSSWISEGQGYISLRQITGESMSEVMTDVR